MDWKYHFIARFKRKFMVEINGKTIEGLLIDLDGTVYIHGKVLEGAQETIDALLETYNVLFLTNTDSKSKPSLMSYYERIGLQLPEDKVYSVPEFAKEFLLENEKTVYFIVSEDLEDYFSDLKRDGFDPDIVLIGDVGTTSDLNARLNTALRCLKRGAELWVLQKGITYVATSGLALDSGSYGQMLESAAGVKMKVMGKPNPLFFEAGAKRLGVPLEKICVIGDDLEADIEGGKNVGAATVLVKTGKYDDEVLAEYEERGIVPDAILDRFTEIDRIFPLKK